MKEYIVRLEHDADGAVHYFRTGDEIVRCRDCKWRDDIGCAIRIVDESDRPKDDGYCCFGERRTDA